jgi:hypothetical protein
MAHLKFGPANIGHGPVEAAGQSYLESEKERWEETKELGPTGTLARGFQAGLTGPAPTVESAGQSYIESEQERWEETKELGPTGTLARDFQFGLTGPAPTVRPNPEAPLTPTIDRGPEPLNTANTAAEEVVQESSGLPGLGENLGPDDGGLAGGFKLLVGVVLALVSVIALGQLFEVQV